MTTRPIALALLFVGASAGGFLGRRALGASAPDVTYSPVPTRIAAASPAPSGRQALPPPPGDSLRVDVTPTRIAHGADGASLELEVSITNPQPGAVKARYAFEVVDDRGVAQMAAAVSAPLRLAAGDVERARVLTPAGLADGYYAARVTVAVRGDDSSAADGNTTYLHVEGGEITPIDFTTFHHESRAHEAF